MLFPFSLRLLSLLLFLLPTLLLAASPPSPDPAAFPIQYPAPALSASDPLPSPDSAANKERLRQTRGLFGHPVGEGAVVVERSEAERLELDERGWDDSAAAVGEGVRMEKRVRKRGCAYVGTFFRL